jgi:hypothetical protein
VRIKLGRFPLPVQIPGSLRYILLAPIHLIAEEVLVESAQAENSLFSTVNVFSGLLALL